VGAEEFDIGAHADDILEPAQYVQRKIAAADRPRAIASASKKLIRLDPCDGSRQPPKTGDETSGCKRVGEAFLEPRRQMLPSLAFDDASRLIRRLFLETEANQALHPLLEASAIEDVADPLRQTVERQMASDDRFVSPRPSKPNDICALRFMRCEQPLVLRLAFGEIKKLESAFTEKLLDREPLQNRPDRMVPEIGVVTEVSVGDHTIDDRAIQVRHGLVPV
jgi:hypothetical protein